jgi:hypothetical protein
VVAAAELAVVGVGTPIGGPGPNVITLATVRGLVAAVVGPAPVAYLEGPAGGAGEPASVAQVDDPGGPVEPVIDVDRLATWMDEAGLPGEGEPIEATRVSEGLAERDLRDSSW